MKYPLFLLLFCLACGTAKKAQPEYQPPTVVYWQGMGIILDPEVVKSHNLVNGQSIYTDSMFRVVMRADAAHRLAKAQKAQLENTTY